MVGEKSGATGKLFFGTDAIHEGTSIAGRAEVPYLSKTAPTRIDIGSKVKYKVDQGITGLADYGF